MSNDFIKELEALLNKHGWDNDTNTPDWILAKHLYAALMSYKETTDDVSNYGSLSDHEEKEETQISKMTQEQYKKNRDRILKTLTADPTKETDNTMNSTDKQKLAIREMFGEPINEVEVAVIELIGAYSCGYKKRESINKVKQKIQDLKSMLPIVQE